MPPTRSNPVHEVNLSQARNKALEKLGIGLSDKSPVAKPWKAWYQPWFESPEQEHEYCEAAYSLHRRFLVRLLVQGGLGYLLVAVLWLVLVLTRMSSFVGVGGMENGVRVAAATIRFVFSISCLGAAYVIQRDAIGPRTAAVLVLSLAYLVAAVPLIDVARDLNDASDSEAVEIVLIFLIAYRLLVPIFQVRHVAVAMWLLSFVQVVYMLLLYSEDLELRAALIARELVKGLTLNVTGVAMGLMAERNRRKNFLGAALYHEEVVLMSAVRHDVQRLLLNTLPEPIVEEVASGQVEVAHRYEHVTVVQADMVGFTPLSASRPPSEVLSILSELFGTFDDLAECYGAREATPDQLPALSPLSADPLPTVLSDLSPRLSPGSISLFGYLPTISRRLPRSADSCARARLPSRRRPEGEDDRRRLHRMRGRLPGACQERRRGRQRVRDARGIGRARREHGPRHAAGGARQGDGDGPRHWRAHWRAHGHGDGRHHWHRALPLRHVGQRRHRRDAHGGARCQGSCAHLRQDGQPRRRRHPPRRRP